VLEHRHVAADLAEATERYDAERPFRKARWRVQLGVRMAQGES
jgi:hypothetical protein